LRKLLSDSVCHLTRRLSQVSWTVGLNVRRQPDPMSRSSEGSPAQWRGAGHGATLPRLRQPAWRSINGGTACAASRIRRGGAGLGAGALLRIKGIECELARMNPYKS